MINKGYPETHNTGIISIENYPEELKLGYMKGDLGIQISSDGRVWVCINGVAFLRFKPHTSNLTIKPMVVDR